MIKNIKKYFILYFIICLILLFIFSKIDLITLFVGLSILISLLVYQVFGYFYRKKNFDKNVIKLKEFDIKIIERELTLIETLAFKNNDYLIKVLFSYLTFLFGTIVFFSNFKDKSAEIEIILTEVLEEQLFFSILIYSSILMVILMTITFLDTKLLSEYKEKLENILNKKYKKEK